MKQGCRRLLALHGLVRGLLPQDRLRPQGLETCLRPLGGGLALDLVDQASDSLPFLGTFLAGAEIVNYYKQGSAYYAPSAAVLDMVASILHDKKKILPCAVYLKGEYGLTDLFVGVPCVLGSRGMEKVIELELSEAEKAALNHSADAVRDLMKVLPSF